MSEAAPSPTPPSPPAKKRSGASIAIAVLGFAATLGVGFLAGQWIRETWFVPSAKLDEGERYRADLRGDEPQKGPDDALVTVVIYSDFQCPFCSRVNEPLDEALDDYEGDVRVIFKHYPLPGHSAAVPAAYASWAAHQQGKFWEYHDLLFANQKALGEAELVKYAEKVGLDIAKFDADRKSDAAKKVVDGDHASGGKAGVSGTPSFLVNGHPYSGAMPAKHWREIFSYESKAAKALIDAGTPRAGVYEALMKDAKAVRPGGGVGKAPGQRRAGEPDPAKSYKVPLDARPQLGADDALITMVIFSDFQCPFCKKVNETIDRLKQTYGKDLRLVFRQRPLAMHPGARDGSRAALAAHRQGKFWEFHDKLFENPKDMSKETFLRYAQELGLDTAMFELDLAAADIEQMIKDDEALATKLGANGTPAFFINGRFINGNQSFETFSAVIDEEKTKAEALVAAGTPPAGVYAKILETAEAKPGK